MWYEVRLRRIFINFTYIFQDYQTIHILLEKSYQHRSNAQTELKNYIKNIHFKWTSEQKCYQFSKFKTCKSGSKVLTKHYCDTQVIAKGIDPIFHVLNFFA